MKNAKRRRRANPRPISHASTVSDKRTNGRWWARWSRVNWLTGFGFVGAIIVFLWPIGKEWWASSHALQGQLIFSSVGVDPYDTTERPKILVYVALENTREAPLAPHKYLLEVNDGNGWKELRLAPDRPNEFAVQFAKKDAGVWGFSSGFSMQLTPQMFLTTDLTRPLAQGIPRRGFLWFQQVEPYVPSKVHSMRLLVSDALANTYVIVSDDKLWEDPRELLRMEPDIQLVPTP